jgi:hypothetical protein
MSKNERALVFGAFSALVMIVAGTVIGIGSNSSLRSYGPAGDFLAMRSERTQLGEGLASGRSLASAPHSCSGCGPLTEVYARFYAAPNSRAEKPGSRARKVREREESAILNDGAKQILLILKKVVRDELRSGWVPSLSSISPERQAIATFIAKTAERDGSRIVLDRVAVEYTRGMGPILKMIQDDVTELASRGVFTPEQRDAVLDAVSVVLGESQE